MTEAVPPNLRTSAPRLNSLRFVAAEGISLRIVVAVAFSLICAAALVALSGHNPVSAFAAIAMGAAGSPLADVATQARAPYIPVVSAGMPRSTLWSLCIPLIAVAISTALREPASGRGEHPVGDRV